MSSKRPVAGGGAERERDQDGQPVERLAGARDDAVDRQRAFPGVPDAEHDGEEDREHRRGERQRDVVLVGEDVGVEGAGHAEDDDGQPVRERVVPRQPHLPEEHGREHDGEDQRGVHQPDAEVDADPVGEALADGGAQDLDDPEPDGDLGHLVEQRSGGQGRVRLGRHGCRSHDSMMQGRVERPLTLRFALG